MNKICTHVGGVFLAVSLALLFFPWSVSPRSPSEPVFFFGYTGF